MSIKELRQFLAALPDTCDDFEVCTMTRSGSFPRNMKRVVCWHWMDKDLRENGQLVFNPMGTHFDDEQWMEISNGLIANSTTNPPLLRTSNDTPSESQCSNAI